MRHFIMRLEGGPVRARWVISRVFPCLWQIKLKQRRVNNSWFTFVSGDLSQCLGTIAVDIQDEVSDTHTTFNHMQGSDCGCRRAQRAGVGTWVVVASQSRVKVVPVQSIVSAQCTPLFWVRWSCWLRESSSEPASGLSQDVCRDQAALSALGPKQQRGTVLVQLCWAASLWRGVELKLFPLGHFCCCCCCSSCPFLAFCSAYHEDSTAVWCSWIFT